MKIVRMMKDAVLSPFMVLLIPRTLRRMDDLFRSTHELFRRSDELFGKADELFRRSDELFGKADELFRRTDELFSKTDELSRRSDDLSQKGDDLLRRMQAAEDWLRGEGMAKISAHVQDAQAASLAAQGMLKSLEANLRDLAQLRAELQRRAGE